jgi:YVTN family beta-propeller protein
MLQNLFRKWSTLSGHPRCQPAARLHRHRYVPVLEALEERSLLSIQVEPGYVYGPTDIGVRQWTPDLQVVGDQRVLAGPYGMAGAAITPDGLFLTCGYELNGDQPGDHLIALGPDGGIVHDLYLTNLGLNRDSGIAIDASGNILVSSPLGVHLVAPDFSTQMLLPISVGRAAGLALDAQGQLFVVDQANDQIVVLDPDYQVLRTIPTGPTPRQVAFGPDGNLYYTDDPYRTPTEYLSRLVQVDGGQDDAQTVVLHGLPFMNSITFAPDGSFYLGLSNGRSLSWFSPDGQLLSSIDHGSGLVDAVAYYPSGGGGGSPIHRAPPNHDAELAGTLGKLLATPGAEAGRWARGPVGIPSGPEAGGPGRPEPYPGDLSRRNFLTGDEQQSPSTPLVGRAPEDRGQRAEDWLGVIGAESRLSGPADSVPVD